ncbi:MAG: hypothetical protein BWY71_02067 [Planctomycetes bacterium ADurb.Bin412]|nr:MAG: hypothetical protein BWY71_02067 [Planctomycetes bacterium ADurb.Bin412]
MRGKPFPDRFGQSIRDLIITADAAVPFAQPVFGKNVITGNETQIAAGGVFFLLIIPVVLSHQAAETGGSPVAFRGIFKGDMTDGLALGAGIFIVPDDDPDRMHDIRRQSGLEIDKNFVRGAPGAETIDGFPQDIVDIHIGFAAGQAAHRPPVDIRTGEREGQAAAGRIAFPDLSLVGLRFIFLRPTAGIFHFRAGRADYFGFPADNGIGRFRMRFEGIAGRPVAGFYGFLFQGEVHAAEGIVGEIAVMPEGLAAGVYIRTGFIEQFHEAEHRFGAIAPDPVLFGQVAAGADHHAVHIVGVGAAPGIFIGGKDTEVLVQVLAVDNAPEVAGGHQGGAAGQGRFVPVAVVKIAPGAGGHFIGYGAAGRANAPKSAPLPLDIPAFFRKDVKIAVAEVGIVAEIADAVAVVGPGEFIIFPIEEVGFRGDDIPLIFPGFSLVSAGGQSDFARRPAARRMEPVAAFLFDMQGGIQFPL